MAVGGSRSLAVALLATLAAGILFWGASTFTGFSLDARVAQVKSAAVSLLESEARLGVVNRQLAANLTVPNLPKSQLRQRINAYLASAATQYREIFTPARTRWYSHLQARGLRLWLQDAPKQIVSEQRLQVQYWEQVTLTDFGAWVKVRGQFKQVVNGRTVKKPPATISLRIEGNPASGYRISNEKWLNYNPS